MAMATFEREMVDSIPEPEVEVATANPVGFGDPVGPAADESDVESPAVLSLESVGARLTALERRDVPDTDFASLLAQFSEAPLNWQCAALPSRSYSYKKPPASAAAIMRRYGSTHARARACLGP